MAALARKISWVFVHFLLFFIFRSKSFFERLKLIFSKKELIHFYNHEFTSGKILVMAIRQTSMLRRDLIRVLQIAKEQNFYVILVNTSRVDNPGHLKEFSDCYIEKCDYGRDFGSYKTALMFIYKNNYEKSCRRLLLLNDSVFYARTNLSIFLKRLADSDADVVGATENFEIEYHIGSFCLSLSGDILREKKFMKYWKDYVPTSVRPDVIKKGEMGLSKILRNITKNIEVLYDINWFSSFIDDDDLIKNAIYYSRKSDKAGPTLIGEINRYIEKNSVFPLEVFPPELFFVSNLSVGRNKTRKDKDVDVTNIDILELKESIRKNFNNLTKEILLRIFPRNSQIHQNALILFKAGLPLVKLDAVYRGVLDESDVYRLAAMMHPEDAAEFKRLVFARQFGGFSLSGLQRVYFEHGFI